MAREQQATQAPVQKDNVSFLSISREREGEVLPMSYSQEQLWFLQRLDPGMTAYNLPRVLRLHGAVDADALERAFKAVIARHAILRTRFFEQGGVPVQQVLADVPFTLRRVDLSKQRGGRKEALLDHEIEEVVSHVFELGEAPALVARLIKVGAKEHVLAFCMHHIVSDGWSNPILAKDLSSAYQMALISEEDVHLPPLAFQYGDFALWQREQQESGDWERQLAYWHEHLGPEVPPLELPSSRAGSTGKSFKGADLTFMLPKDVDAAVRRFCKDEKLTPFVPMFAAWQVLLAKYSGQQDFAVGVPHAGRSREEFHDIVGYFVNPLVFRVRLAPELTWRGLCRRIRSEVVSSMGNADLPFERLLAERPERRGGGVDPLFQTLFDFQQRGASEGLSLGGIPAELVERGASSAKVDLALNMAVNADHIQGRVEFNSDLFDEQVAVCLKDYYVRILVHFISSPEQRIAAYALPEGHEQDQLTAWGVNGERYADAQPVHRLIETQVIKSPQATALLFGEQELSYVELNARANRLAHRLISLGVGPEVRVGVALERSLELVVSLLAILKAGGAYVPLDPDYPVERLAYMVGDSGIGLLLSHSTQGGRLRTAEGVLVLAVDSLDLAAEPVTNPDVAVGGENLAYVIYTSGSTGHPKGAANRHRSLYNRLEWMQQAYGLNASDTVLQKTPYSFDVSVWEFFWPLMTGARLAVANPGDHRDPERLVEQIQRNAVTTLHFVPSMLQAFLAHPGIEACTSLKRIVCSGEALPAEAQAGVFARLPRVALYNLYGPTEAAIDVTHWTCRADGNTQVPIGRPIADTKTHVLDSDLNLAPQGVAGELYLGGIGLARGYLNRAGLTAERFIADPFGEAGGRLYRTGDLVKWNAEGELEYLGRIDHQVKIRGFRIELGEIEAKLLGQPEVREAVVVASEGLGGARLVGYVSLHEPIETAELRERLGLELPEYMVPSIVMVLDALPLNANGKIDRRALPTPEVGAEGEYEAPMGALEETLAAIWSDVLEVERVGRNDDFFRLGGHSLLALKLLERIRAKGLAVQVRTLFEHPKLADFAQAINQGEQRPDVVVPLNLIPDGCGRIEPEMVTLAKLTEEQLRQIEASVADGAVNIQDIYPLAPLQEGILFHHLLQEQGDVYVTTHGLGFDTKEGLEGFVESFNRVIARHDILRTAVLWEGLDEPVQVVWRQAELRVQWVEEIGNLRGYRIDVRQAPMIHALATFDERGQRWRLQLLTHHLVTDHTTLEQAIREISLIQQGHDEQLVEPVPFRRFVAQARLGVNRAEHEAYFEAQLGDVEEPTTPWGLLDVRGDGTRVQEARLLLNSTLSQAIREQAKRYAVSAAALFHLAWALVLARSSGRDDVVFGTVLFGRMQGGEGADRAMGMFINMLPLRVRLGSHPVTQCLKEVQLGLTALLHHEHATLALAQKCSGVSAGTPLFSAMLNYRYSSQRAAMEWAGIEALGGGERTNYPLELSVDDLGDGFRLTARLDESVAADRICELVQSASEAIVNALAHETQRSVAVLDLLGETERARLTAWSVNNERYADVEPVHRLIEAQVVARPEALAVVFGDESLSYAQLNARANRLAHRLVGLGVGPEVRVGVALERSVELVVSLLAILKSGGAYVPLDPDYPAERLAYMVGDSGIGLLLTHSELAGRLPAADGVQMVEVDSLDLAGEPATNPDVAVSGENLCYVIYTSGSTGKPKGAANRHRSLYNRLTWMQQAYGLNASDTVLQKTPYSFDVSVWEFFWPLMTGARLAVAHPGDHRDPARLVEQIQRNAVTTLHFVPSMLQAFLAHEGIEACTSLKRIVCSGEALPAEAQAGVFARLPGVELYNLYGPTEAAIDVTHWTCRDDGNTQVPIGRPIADTKTYVLDGSLNLAPQGVVGELYLGGIGLARGYLNRSTLTAERFVADPFDEVGGRLYRTGDLVKWNAEGKLEYLGRIDHQVKIRGFRIELGEIEAKLLSQPEVREAVVVAGEGPGGARLVGYVSLHAPIEVAELRERLGRELPEYMVPGVIMVLDTLPLNVNGKIDRKVLPVPEVGVESEYEAPVGEVEEALARIWSEVLKVPQEKVGRHSNFFGLGGDSILSLQVVARTRSQGHAITLRLVFEHQVLAGLAAALAGLGDESVGIPLLDPQRRAEPLPLSYAQQRLWFLWNLDPKSTAYHMSMALRLSGDLDVAALTAAFERLVARHEALRTVFRLNVQGQVQQIIQPAGGALLQVRECSGGDSTEEVIQLHSESFDLMKGPLFRAMLLREAEDRHVLVVVMHHIVSDDWTVKLVVDELIEDYRARIEGREPKFAVQTIQYVDYAVWQRDWMQTGERDRQLAYWKAQLGGEQPVLNLATDHPRRSDGQYRRVSCSLELSAEIVSGVRSRMQASQGTLFMGLLVGVHALLHRYSGQEDIRVGVPIANRHHPGTDGVVGVFTNTQVLRAQLNSQMTFAVLLEQVKAAALGAQAHQDLPFEELVEVLQPERSLSTTPLFQVMFNHLREGGADRLAQLPGLKLESFGQDAEQAAKFELTVSTNEKADGRVSVAFEYARELFESETIKRMVGHYVAVLRALAEDSQHEIGKLDLLDEAEHRQLDEWGVSAVRYSGAQPVHRLIEAQGRERPYAVALMFGDERLSYGELNVRANRLAHRLIALGVGPEVRVGVALERSIELVVSLLAILKAGGAYVPLDPELPVERLSYMMEDSGIGLLLTHSALVGRMPTADDVRVVEVDGLDLTGEADSDPDVLVRIENLVYVIYTSGSTGRPKGAANRHRALYNRLLWGQGHCPLGTDDVVLQKTPYSFDISFWEFFWPLSVGARLALAGPGEHRDPARLMDLINQYGVTTIHFVPSMLQAFVAYLNGQRFPTLKSIVCSGEALPMELQGRVFSVLPEVSLLNLYGPTEAAIEVTWWNCRANGSTQVPIGRPISDTKTYVLDGSLNLVPQGVAGELYLGGVGLARGYLNRPSLTAERFVADPFDESGANGRLYRTGDLVKWNAQGELEYLGRIDHQVKIRGFRIELGEVEAKLLTHSEVREAVVVAGEGPGGTRLVGYVSLNAPIEAVELRERLGRELPEYMVPGTIMVLDTLPLNANGKIDRKALPVPEVGAEGEYEAPMGEVEEALADIWAEVLEVERVGRNDDFFRLGGHSLLALKLLERIRANGHAVQVRTLFEYPKLADFVRAIGQGEQRQDVVVPPNLIPEGCERIEPEMVTLAKLTAEQLRHIEASVPGGAANIQDIYPLAPLQEGILFHHLLQEEGDVYITSTDLRFDTKARLEGFVESFNRVIARHDILRTAVLWEGGLNEPVQVVWRQAELQVQWVDEIGDLGSYRIDVRKAPMIHALAAFDARQRRWQVQLLAQHLGFIRK